MKYVLLALLLLSVEAATFSYAQTSNLSFKSLNRQNGLLGNVNSFMYRDSRGFVWISSIQGLNRFDGSHIKTYVYDKVKPNSLRGNNIQSQFFEDKNGDIWFCTEEAINVYRRQSDHIEHFYVYDERGNELKNEYYVFHLDAKGGLWLRVGEYKNAKLYCFNTLTGKTVASQTDLKRAELLGDFAGLRTIVEPTENGNETNLLSFFWGGKLGIVAYKYDEKRQQKSVQPYFSGQKNDIFPQEVTFKVKQVVYDSTRNGFWMATEKGLVFWNKKTNKYTIFNTFKEGKVTELTDIILREDEIFATSKKLGVWVFDKKKQVFTRQILPKFTNTEGVQLMRFDNLYLDKEDNLWLSSSDNGLFYANLQRAKFDILRFPSTSLTTSTDNMIEDADGNKWVARRGAGVVVFNRNHQIMPQFLSSNLTDYIKRLYRDQEGDIWVLTGSNSPAMYRYNPPKRAFDLIPFDKNQSLDSLQLSDICQISDGRLLIGTSKGVFEFDKSGKAKTLKKSQIVGINEAIPNVVDIFEDRNKTIFLNQNSQNLVLCRLENKIIIKIQEVPVNGETVGFMEEEKKLWLASNKGLLAYDHSGEQLSNPSTHLLGLRIEGVLRDTAGHFWLSSSDGILDFDPKTGNYRRFSTADMMQGYNFGRSTLADTEGYFWFGGTNGINVFKPTEVKNFPFAPRPHITDILVNNAPYRPDTSIIEKKRLVLPYDSNTVRLDFTAVEFSDAPSDSISYTFNLADLDSTKWVWKTTANAADPSVSYINLREGAYVLRLKAVNSDGIWSATRILELRILPPWHRTWWFYTFLLALGLGTTYAIVQKVVAFREKQLKAQAAFEQKIKETELQVLRLQMNPHFIFSALNSIRAYVLDKDSDAASKFLADFAHLMRQILQYSTEESITLEKEEALLRGYLEMEQLRFDFDFDIKIADDLDTFETEVPPMILQPFVENAILHGIASKRDDKGVILVRFDKEDNSVLCSVQDNGLGMGKSLRKKHQDHESKSRAITQDRLDIITQLTGRPTALLYENVETGGTKVTIRLPVNLGTLDD